jgi:hypothetical protein
MQVLGFIFVILKWLFSHRKLVGRLACCGVIFFGFFIGIIGILGFIVLLMLKKGMVKEEEE